MSEPLIISAEAFVRSPRPDHRSLLDTDAEVSAETVMAFKASQQLIARGIELLRGDGFDIGATTPFGFGFNGQRAQFEKAFGVTLSWDDDAGSWEISPASAVDDHGITGAQTGDPSVFDAIRITSRSINESGDLVGEPAEALPGGRTKDPPAEPHDRVDPTDLPAHLGASAGFLAGQLQRVPGVTYPRIVIFDTGFDGQHPFFLGRANLPTDARQSIDSEMYTSNHVRLSSLVASYKQLIAQTEELLKKPHRDVLEQVKKLGLNLQTEIGSRTARTVIASFLSAAQARVDHPRDPVVRDAAARAAAALLRMQIPADAQKELARLAHPDPVGHGTTMASQVLSVAPLVDLVSVRDKSEADGGLSSTGQVAIVAAVRRKARVISLSLAYRVTWDSANRTFAKSGASGEVRAFRAMAILAAKNAVVLLAAGNGAPTAKQDATTFHVAETASFSKHDGILSVGGVYRREGDYVASDATNAFVLAEGRNEVRIPTVCGIAGPMSDMKYVWVPTTNGGKHASSESGWRGANTGSSGATAQVAGVCALVLLAFPNASPQDVKAILVQSARQVTEGTSAQRISLPTGAGVVQIEAAIGEARGRAAKSAAPPAVPTGHGGNVVQVVANGS